MAKRDYGGGSSTQEYTLVDLWVIFTRRKSIIFLTISTAFLVAAVLVIFSRPIYQSRAVIEIGVLDEIGVLENTPHVMTRLKEKYGLDGSLGTGSFPRLGSVATAGENIIVLTAQGRTAASAQEFLSHVTADLLDRHRKIYDAGRSRLEARLEAFDASIATIERQLGALDSSRQNLADNAQAAVVAIERGQLLLALSRIREAREEIAVSLSPVKAYPSRFINETTLPVTPVAPKPLAYFAFAMFLGVLLAGFIVLVVEAISKARRDLRQD